MIEPVEILSVIEPVEIPPVIELVEILPVIEPVEIPRLFSSTGEWVDELCRHAVVSQKDRTYLRMSR